MFLRDIRCVFPSGISSRKSLAKFAFQEMLVSLCFCQRSQRVGAALEFHSRSSESLSSERGRGGSQVLLPWFYSSMETGAVWHLDPATSHLPAAPAPMELGTQETETSPGKKSGKRSRAGKGSIQRLFPLPFLWNGIWGIFPEQGRSLGVLSPVLWEQQLTANGAMLQTSGSASQCQNPPLFPFLFPFLCLFL